MRITDVQIHDVEHVTAHRVSVDEIEQALFNKPVIKRNRKDQKATYLAKGTADSGATIIIPFDLHGTTAWVFTAWRLGT